MFPIEKYRFVVSGNKVIALSSYAGRTVRGIAVCSPEDEFDLDYGKRLAAARCNEKICAKRRFRAADKRAEAEQFYLMAKEHLQKMNEYYNDSVTKHYKAMTEECELEFQIENF